MTTLLSESLVQVMVGVGLAIAVQLSTKLSLSFTVWLPEMWVMFGGPISIKVHP